MTSNNDSRKRRRVTFEDDGEAPSGRARVDGRDIEEDHGLSSGQEDQGIGHVARYDDVSTRCVGEATSDGSGAPSREHSGPIGPPRQLPASADQSLRNERLSDGNGGHTGDGHQAERRALQSSTGRTTTGIGRVVTESDILSYIRRLAGGGPDITSVRGEDDADWAEVVGPYRPSPIGTMTAQAVYGLAKGDAPKGSLDAFICNNITWELVMTKSPTREVLSVHNPIKRLMLVCNICYHDGTHSTGQCAMVTSEKHGDTNTDPFCNCSCSRAQDRHGQATHGLQRSQDSGPASVQIICAKLAVQWEQGNMGVLFQKFVVERRRMAPLLVYTKDFCFIRLALFYADYFCEGEVPKALEGMWPYTKADAIKYKDQLRRFHETGLENMPKGELEGLSMAEIRGKYDRRGGIPPQYRSQT